MPRLLRVDELYNTLKLEYSKKILKESRFKRLFNIYSFNAINRTGGLSYKSVEKRLILYSTLKNETIGIQYPGKESGKDTKTPKPFDFYPFIQVKGQNLELNMSFGNIWKVFIKLAERCNCKDLSYISALIYDMSYLQRYKKKNNSYRTELVDIHANRVIFTGQETLQWYCLDFSDDFWYTLNALFGPIDLGNGQTVSIEAFIKFVDLLFQNEDCKYYYINTELKEYKTADEKEKIKAEYEKKLDNGRVGSSNSNLLVLSYLQGHTELADLLDSFQKGRGTTGFNKKPGYTLVTNGIVINID